MATTYVVPDTYEQAEVLFYAGLLYCNTSTGKPRAAEWGHMHPIHEWLLPKVRAAMREDRISGPGWWKTDFAYAVED